MRLQVMLENGTTDIKCETLIYVSHKMSLYWSSKLMCLALESWRTVLSVSLHDMGITSYLK